MADLGMDASPLPIELVDDTTGFEAGVNSSREQLVHDATIASDLGIINADLTGGGQKTQIVDGSGNVITSTAQGTKQSLDVSMLAPTAAYYSAPVSIRQSAATAAGSTVWTMRNPAASAKTVYIERICLTADFDTGSPLGRTLQRYDLERFTAATPTGGTAVTVATMDTANAATAVTDVRFLDTGLTTTSVVFAAPFVTIGVPTSDGSINPFLRERIGFKLAAGEGLAIRLNNAAVVGQGLTGEIVWSER